MLITFIAHMNLMHVTHNADQLVESNILLDASCVGIINTIDNMLQKQ